MEHPSSDAIGAKQALMHLDEVVPAESTDDEISFKALPPPSIAGNAEDNIRLSRLHTKITRRRVVLVDLHAARTTSTLATTALGALE